MKKYKNVLLVLLTVFLFVIIHRLLFEIPEKEKQNDLSDKVIGTDAYKKAISLAFNNELRRLHGMRILDSLKFNEFEYDDGGEGRFSFIKKNPQINEVFRVDYNPEYNLVSDSFLIGKDSVFRIQSQIKNGKYNILLTAGLFTTKDESHLAMKLDEFLHFCKNTKLVKKGDTLFYGYNPDLFFKSVW